MAAMMALDGRLSVEALTGMADDESAAMALARSISDAIDSADIQRNWVKVASNRKPASSPLISFGQDLLEDEPIDGLDILALEPHLIAQTILDSEDEAGETTMSRDVLARMFEDFYSISDEELAELCTARPVSGVADMECRQRRNIHIRAPSVYFGDFFLEAFVYTARFIRCDPLGRVSSTSA